MGYEAPIGARGQGRTQPPTHGQIADGTLCGRDPDEIGVPARWALDGTEDERQGFSQSREKGGEGVRVSATSLELM
ncbi:hypothetical protein ACHAPV_009040, partial [Trichoderma viride]